MPRGSKPGERRGGRKAGTPNKSTEALQAMLERVGCSPLEGLALISTRRVSCGTCVDQEGKPTGITRYGLSEGTHAKDCKAIKGTPHLGENCSCAGIGERVCLSCFGTLRERIGADLKFKADAELAQYIAPKKKAVEHTGADGEPIKHAHTITFVE